MTVFDLNGVEIDLEQFEDGSLVIARVTKPMSKEEFASFCRGNDMLHKEFRKRGISLVFCPDWVEFKEWK